MRINPFNIGSNTFKCEKIGTEYIYQGDIVLTENQINKGSSLKSLSTTQGGYVDELAERWPAGLVYYTIDSKIENVKRINKAIKHWKRNTNIQFIERTNESNFIEFQWHDSICSSNLGMIGDKQRIRVADWGTKGTMIHEIGHAIGLIHEHERWDRDDYVNIDFENIKENKKHNYELDGTSNSYGNFDFKSIMLYGSYSGSFAVDRNKPIITKKDGTTYKAQRSYLSKGDLKTIKWIYPSNKSGFRCIYQFNESYIDGSGNNYHATNYGTTFVPNRFGKENAAIIFDGKNDYVELHPNSMKDLEKFTFSLWVKPEKYEGDTWPAFIGSHIKGNTAYNTFIGLARSSGNLHCEIHTEKGNYKFEGDIMIPWNEWSYVVMVYNGKTLTEYVNGIKGKSISASGKLSDLQILHLGDYRSTGSDKYHGILDDVLIFRQALTQEEILDFYSAGGWPQSVSAYETGTVVDIENNIYKTVKIGEQWWMAENLSVTKYADGTAIQNITDNSSWAILSDNNVDKAYCFYNNDESSNTGALYTHAAATNGITSDEEVQGVCPSGWHLPSDNEWAKLEDYLANNGYNHDGTIGGGRNKISKALASESDWSGSNGVGTIGYDSSENNSTGFSAKPTGYRSYDKGKFLYKGNRCRWWTSTSYSSQFSYFRGLIYNSKMERTYSSNSSGFCVRCVKDSAK